MHGMVDSAKNQCAQDVDNDVQHCAPTGCIQDIRCALVKPLYPESVAMSKWTKRNAQVIGLTMLLSSLARRKRSYRDLHDYGSHRSPLDLGKTKSMYINNTFGYDRAQRSASQPLVRGRAVSLCWRELPLIPDLGRLRRHAQCNAAFPTLCTTYTLITFSFSLISFLSQISRHGIVTRSFAPFRPKLTQVNPS